MVTDVDGTAKRAAAVLLQDVHNVTQKFLGYFPKVSANKCTHTSPQEFLCICCRWFFFPSARQNCPKGAVTHLWQGPRQAEVRAGSSPEQLLSLCTPWASSQWWHNCLRNSGNAAFYSARPIKWSPLWKEWACQSKLCLICGVGKKNSSFEKSCWFNIIIAKAEKSTN